MDVDSDDPPSLVEVKASHTEQVPDSTTAQLKDLSLTKVPMTIVTGNYPKHILPSSKIAC